MRARTQITVLIGLSLIMTIPIPTAVAEPTDPVDCEALADAIAEILDSFGVTNLPELEKLLREFVLECDPCEYPNVKEVCEAVEPNILPDATLHFDFSIRNCNGVREHVTRDEYRVGAGGGAAKVGPAVGAFGFFGAMYTSESKGYLWSFTCDIVIRELRGWGEGGLFRKIVVEGTSPENTETAAQCAYIGGPAGDDPCWTENLLSGTYSFTVSSDGVEGGYPTQASAELAASAVNEPLGPYRQCLEVGDEFCISVPSVGEIIDPLSYGHSPAHSESAEISWTEVGLGIGDVVENVEEYVDRILRDL